MNDIMKLISEPYIRLILLCIILYCLAATVPSFLKNREKRKKKAEIRKLADSSEEIPAGEFLRLRKTKGKGGNYYSSSMEFAGIYILLNKTKRKYYVGQSKNVLGRVTQHFTGHGNGDVYADFKYGDRFCIRTVKLQGSGCRTLNELERLAIEEYGAFYKGYNRNRGNH